MADDAHRQLRGASEQSLEHLFKGLTEILGRLEAYEAHLAQVERQVEADHEQHERVEQATKDAIGLALALRDSEQRPVTADGASGDWAAPGVPSPPRRPHLRVILGGLAVAATAALIPAGAAAVTHHASAHHHVSATRVHRRVGRDPDPSATMRA